MKKALLFSLFSLILFSSAVFAQEPPVKAGQLYAVIEYRHSSETTATPDLKTQEVDGIVRYMTSSTIGFTGAARMNDTSSNFMAGITFMPSENFRFDVLGGSRIQDQSQKSIVGFRFWAGNSWQNFWFNIDGGSAPGWFECIYFLSVT